MASGGRPSRRKRPSEPVRVVVISAGAWYTLQKPGFGAGSHAYGTLYYATLGTFLAVVAAGTVLSLLTTLRAIGGQFSRRAERVRELLRRLRQAILFWADADLEPSYKDGSLGSQSTENNGLTSVYEISAATSGGMSGGPVVDDSGSVMGFVDFKNATETQAFNFMRPVSPDP